MPISTLISMNTRKKALVDTVRRNISRVVFHALLACLVDERILL